MVLFRRLLLLLILVAMVVGIVYAFLPQPVPVDVAAVSRGPLRVTVQEDGKTRIKERYIVSAPLSGQLLRVVMEPGDQLAANESLLAVLEPNDPETAGRARTGRRRSSFESGRGESPAGDPVAAAGRSDHGPGRNRIGPPATVEGA